MKQCELFFDSGSILYWDSTLHILGFFSLQSLQHAPLSLPAPSSISDREQAIPSQANPRPVIPIRAPSISIRLNLATVE